MRDSVVYHGVTYTRENIATMKREILEAEAALNAPPEPLKPGDIVEYSDSPGRRMMVLGGMANTLLNKHHTYPCDNVKHVRASSGAETFSGPRAMFTKVGNLQDTPRA